MGLTLGDVALGTRWFRSAVAWQPVAAQGFGVDRRNRIIHGIAVVTKGEALGHNLLLDETFLDAVVEQGNRTKTGVKSRFDHPNASGTSMGTMLGRVRQLRRDGDVVRGDLHLLEAASKTPEGDLAGYVMDLAEEDPQAFGASIVFTGDELAQKDADGTERPDVPKLARLKKLMAADVVDQPAANPGGMFSVDDSLAAKATEFLDRYFATKENAAMTKEAVIDKPDITEDVTAIAFEVAHPAVFQEIFASGVAAERARILGIQDAAFAGQEALAKECIAGGSTVEDAKTKFIVAEKASNRSRLDQLKAAGPPSAGGAIDIPRTEDLSDLPQEERWKKEFATTPTLRDEFGSMGAYEAFKAAEAQGLVKILAK
jgi:hypothetical protein